MIVLKRDLGLATKLMIDEIIYLHTGKIIAQLLIPSEEVEGYINTMEIVIMIISGEEETTMIDIIIE
jgi:hypothetical protein